MAVIFNPVEVVNDWVVLTVVAVALWFIYVYKHRVLMALTGDDRLHGSGCDMVWFCCFEWCGTCTGEWTRPISRYLCGCTSWSGKNLLNELGQCLGVRGKPVSLRNIVVGNLDWNGRGNFYLFIECGTDPPQQSHIQEDAHPNVIHFPENFLLRTRWLEPLDMVTITVRHESVLAPVNVAQAHLTPQTVINWAQAGATNRIELKPCSMMLAEAVTPAWVCIEFGYSEQAEEYETLNLYGSTVRVTQADDHYREYEMDDFKDHIPLLDNTGNPLSEPREKDLQYIEWLRVVRHRTICLLFVVLLLASIGYFLVAWYTGSCWKRYRWVTMAYLNQERLPVPLVRQKELASQCELLMKGTGQQDGLVSCRPSVAQIMSICEANSTVWGHQPQPKAFGDIAEELFELDNIGVTCTGKPICMFQQDIAQWHYTAMGIIILGFLLIYAGKTCCDIGIRGIKAKQQRDHAQHQADYRRTTGFSKGTGQQPPGQSSMGGGFQPRRAEGNTRGAAPAASQSSGWW